MDKSTVNKDTSNTTSINLAVDYDISTSTIPVRYIPGNKDSTDAFPVPQNEGPTIAVSVDLASKTDEPTVTIPGDLIPFQGRLYNSKNDVYDNYNLYASWRGFSVRKNGREYNKKTGQVHYLRFLCSKEGWPSSKTLASPTSSTSVTTSDRRTTIRRTGCYARLYVILDEGGKWRVTRFDDAHNHDLIPPDKRHYLRSQRKVTDAQKALIQTLDRANVPTHMQGRIFEIQSGGISHIGCTTGEFAWTPSCGTLPIEDLDEGASKPIGLDSDNDSTANASDSVSIEDMKRKKISQSQSREHNKGRNGGSAQVLTSCFERLVGAVESRIRSGGSVNSESSIPSIASVIGQMDDMSELDPTEDLYMFGLDLFRCKESREIFAALKTNQIKLMWLKKQKKAYEKK